MTALFFFFVRFLFFVVSLSVFVIPMDRSSSSSSSLAAVRAHPFYRGPRRRTTTTAFLESTRTTRSAASFRYSSDQAVARDIQTTTTTVTARNMGSETTATTPTNGSSKTTTKPSIEDVRRVADLVRRRVLEYTLRNNGGYLSQACSSAEALATLYVRALNLGPPVASTLPGPFRGSPSPSVPAVTGEGLNGDFTDPRYDRLIFSPVHYALVLYSLLVEVNRLDVKAFDSYNQDGSTVELIGAEHSPGHAVTAGSLAQALSQAAGIAHARKLKWKQQAKDNEEAEQPQGRVVVYMSDGECQEGQTWETIQAAVFHKLDNLIAVVDVNKQQCDGAMAATMEVGDLAAKIRAFGAIVEVVQDGHDVAAIEQAINSKHGDKCLPKFVLCYTDPCKGFPMLQELAPKLHYVRFKSSEEKSKWEEVLAKMENASTAQEENGGGSADAGEAAHDKKRKAETQTTETETSKLAKTGTSVVTDAATAAVTASSTIIETLDACMMENVVRPHRANLLEWCTKHPRAIIMTADLTSSCEADLVRDELPDQYASMGMAEQNMMSWAGGMAREGYYHPYIHTFGVFITRRPYDQVAMSIGVPNVPVRMLGFLPGLTTPGGCTHQAIDDIALMRSIPNVRVLEVADATEVESILDVAESIDGPVYVRMLRGEVPRLFPKESKMVFGQVRVLSKGTDVTVITSGICTEEALKACKLLKEQQIVTNGNKEVSIQHLHLSTIVPFPSEIVVEAAKTTKFGIVTMENHSVNGGIGSMTAEALAESGDVNQKLIRLGVNGYAHGASRPYLMAEYGIDARALIRAVEKLMGTKLVKDEDDDQAKKPVEQSTLSVEDRPEDL